MKKKTKQPKPLAPADMAVLVDHFEAFLRVPKITYAEWVASDTDTQAALLSAAKRIEVERIVALVQALQHEDGALALLAGLDGGAAFCQAQVGRAVRDHLVHRRMTATLGA